MQTVVLLTFTGGYFFLFIMPDLILDSALLQQHRTPAPLGVMGRSRPVLGTAQRWDFRKSLVQNS